MSLEPLTQFLYGGGARDYIMRSQRLYHEEPGILSWGARDYIMRSQRLVILVFSLSLSQAEELWNMKYESWTMNFDLQTIKYDLWAMDYNLPMKWESTIYLD